MIRRECASDPRAGMEEDVFLADGPGLVVITFNNGRSLLKARAVTFSVIAFDVIGRGPSVDPSMAARLPGPAQQHLSDVRQRWEELVHVLRPSAGADGVALGGQDTERATLRLAHCFACGAVAGDGDVGHPPLCEAWGDDDWRCWRQSVWPLGSSATELASHAPPHFYWHLQARVAREHASPLPADVAAATAMAGGLPEEQQSFLRMYAAALDEELVSVIERDLGRTFAELDPTQRQQLRRVLVTYAAFQPAIGYAQSMNFLAGACLLAGLTEEWTFWTVAALVGEVCGGSTHPG